MTNWCMNNVRKQKRIKAMKGKKENQGKERHREVARWFWHFTKAGK